MARDRFASSGARFYAKKYGLTRDEALCLVDDPDLTGIIRRVEQYREEHGFPAPSSPLVRGKLRELTGCRIKKRK